MAKASASKPFPASSPVPTGQIEPHLAAAIEAIEAHEDELKARLNALATRIRRGGILAETRGEAGRGTVSDTIVHSISRPGEELLVIFGHQIHGQEGDYGVTVREVIRNFRGTVLFMPIDSR